ncbi:MAG TPA: hypothetical protein VLG74_02310, partial [Blastocatellia bacterium]|nr:hypothetical protein [Blastocatellia bacterium]
SVSPSDGNCAVPQDLLISGACFIIPQGSITSVFAVERTNPANRINATNFVVLNNNLIDALFNFTSANAGKTFLIFVTGPGGTSRNLTTQVAGAPAGCPVGNEQGVQVTFTCSSSTTPPPDSAPPDVALVNGCKLDRNQAGNFILDIFGKNLKPTADVRVGSITPRKIKARERDPSIPGAFLRLTLKGGICGGLPGTIVVTNLPVVPGGPTVPSQPFACTERCSAN